MKEGQQGEAPDWWSAVRRDYILRETEHVERVVCGTQESCSLLEHFWCSQCSCCYRCCSGLVALMPASSVHWFKLCTRSAICTQPPKHRHTHRYTQPLPSSDLTCVFIKVSSCSIVLKSNGDWLWHNYTNSCMNLVVMEAEHLTQTKCRRADQCLGAFFLHLSSSQLSPKQNIYICNASPLRQSRWGRRAPRVRWQYRIER